MYYWCAPVIIIVLVLSNDSYYYTNCEFYKQLYQYHLHEFHLQVYAPYNGHLLLPLTGVCTQKIYFSSYVELLVTLMALAIGMWWLFDRSRAGLSFSIFLTLLSSTVTHTLLRYRMIRYVFVPCSVCMAVWNVVTDVYSVVRLD